ncbi:MAG: glycosyltransferase [Planctomycetota bacterium]|jgi:glycosyltransferase involved in cell wall biosynthesis
MKISLCMIARNEEELLSIAVQSATGLYDELVIVDTGSEDNTIEVAQGLADKVLVGADRMNKAQSRNRAIMAATGDWVVILDCDEQIADPIGVREFLETTDAEAVYIRLTYMKGDQGTLSYSQMRAWKRGKYVYKYRAHEVPVPTKGWTKIAHTDFVWEHRPPPDRTWKSAYTLERLILDVAENPGEARPLYYLGRQYSYRKEWQNGLDTLQKYLECPGRDGADAWRVLAKCHAGLGEEREQIIALYNACAREPDRREFWGELATIHHKKGEDDLAVGLLKCALEMPVPTTAYVSHYWHGAEIYDLLARCLWKLERYEEGHKYAKQAVELSPLDERLQKNLVWFEHKLQDGRDTHYMVLGPKYRQGLAVLFVAYQDCSGVAWKMAEALNATRHHRAKVVTYEATYLHYETDYFRPTELELEELVRWADIVHIMDFIPPNMTVFEKPIVLTYNGTTYRYGHEEDNNRARRYGVAAQMCTTLDLTQFGAQWVPVPMGPLPQAEPYDGGIFRVVHAPTKRSRKNTAEIIQQLGDLEGVELDVIEGVANSVCLARKQQAHLLVDQFEFGYGVNALEAWSMGLPVIANATGSALKCISDELGSDLPYVSSTVEDLKMTVLRLQRDPQFYARARARGIDYLAQYHDPAKVADRLVGIYTKALLHDELTKEKRAEKTTSRFVDKRSSVPQLIFITGCAKSGTTLLQRLFYAFDAKVLSSEMTIGQLCQTQLAPESTVLVAKRHRYSVFSEHLSEAKIAHQSMLIKQNSVKIINIIRDGRDLIFSDNENVSPRRWVAAMRQRNHPLLDGLIDVEIKYEDVVSDPDAVQERVAKALGLTIIHRWSEYPGFVPEAEFRPTHGGAYAKRPLDASSVGKGLPYKDLIQDIAMGFDQELTGAGYIESAFQSEAEEMDAFYRQWGPEVHAWYGRKRFMAITYLVQGHKVLDIGCGTGDLLLLLQDISPEWTLGGVDISSVALQMAKDRGFTGELRQSLFGDQWHTIVLSQVLEHLDDDVAMLEAAAARLSNEGRLIVTVPANGRIPSSNHKREYTEEALNALLTPFGHVEFHPLDEYRLLATVEKQGVAQTG